jgi:class 3 adenylate cyclase
VGQRTLEDPLEAARDALDRHAWQEAFDRFREADARKPLSPQDLEAYGQAAWWHGSIENVIAARERAYRAYLDDGNENRAAYVALVLVRDHWNKLEPSIATGWLSRAERLLQGKAESVEHGYLFLTQNNVAMNDGDFDLAVELAGRAVDIGARFGDRDLQARALTNQGLAMVAKGDAKAGMALVDEATVAAVSGELSPIATGIVYCNTIGACSEVADYRRAGEWTEAAQRWCERQSINGFPGVCRVHRAEIIRLRGNWLEAEQEAEQACTELSNHGIPRMAADGFYEIGEIRLKMGDLRAAAEAFTQAHELGKEPQPGLAVLRLQEGKTDAAWSGIRRALDEAAERPQRARLLPPAVTIALAAGDPGSARGAADELEQIAEEFGSTALRAAANTARAEVELAEGDAAEAAKSARRGWQLWQEVEAPYEAARARLVLGRAFRAAGEEDAATPEITAARSSFERLGAVPDAHRASELLTAGEGDGRGERVTRTFVFTDILKSTALVEAMGDEAWEDLLRWHDQTLRSVFAANRGEVVNSTGDGFFVAFDDSRAALQAGVAVQRALAEHRRTHGFAPQVRIGVHAAEATSRGMDFGGKGVHEAARIGALAEGGEILATVETVDIAGQGWEVSEAREVPLKGLSKPVRVVSVAWR